MKTYSVYHAKKPNFGFGEKLSFPQDFELVADVQAKDLEEVFRLTNHIESDWRENKEVIPAPSAKRSTSVGDVVKEFGGDTYECASCGWEKLEIAEKANA
jgi:hypothetical protein